MTTQQIISCWKDEAYRRGQAADVRAMLPVNPAGPSPLDHAPVEASGGLLPATIVLGSAWFSCTFACSQTMWDGTCDFFTYACC
jgi:mersacidin/lichenicidin family type 2 lantibiotic